MRPRGNTQRLYNEAIQMLSGTRVKKQTINSELNDSFESMAVKRRQACSQTVLHVWDAIAYIRQQRQIPNFIRLSAYMKRVYSLTVADFERQLNLALLDGLIFIKKSIGCKGSKVGLEQDAYRVPEEIKENDGHDWYCFECHQGGEVILCTSCHRVYHETCINEDSKSTKFVCQVCKNSEKFSLNIKRSELNTLLGYTCVRLKEKTRELHRIPHPDDEKWRFNFLIYEHMDLTAMEEKMKSNEYLKLADFYSDAQQIVHNVSVYFGIHSHFAEMARQMLGDCEYDLYEIMQCSNCYKMSNTKLDSFWFCQPCDPPHELVYAKVRGFPYWPAKVIKKEEHSYDVRFFGALHQRALILQDYIKPITTPYKKLGIKYTPSFDRAYKELSHHQKLVESASKRRSSSVKSSTEPDEEPKTEINAINDNSSKLKATPLRKRKSAATPMTKPPSAKKTATVPVKKNKKFYQESPTSSSPKNATSEAISIPEDHNFVSSSSQDTSVFHVSVAVQTSKELILLEEKSTEKNNNESNKKVDNSCNCSEKYEILLKDLQTRLDAEHKEEKSKSLKELSDKLQNEMESEKQKKVSNALEELQKEHKEALAKANEQLKASHAEEIRKMIECHNVELSETKKKQWCYNCESEAIYHCCWNTSYCSVECQQVHWHKEHKRTCRRKR